MTVLVVDDAVFMRLVLREILTKGGFEVIGEAENGLKAVELYKKLKPDVVTLDITMPQMDGLAALKAIKEFDANAVVIMCSAMGQENLVQQAVKSGARDFIIKPFKADRIYKAFDNLFAIKR